MGKKKFNGVVTLIFLKKSKKNIRKDNQPIRPFVRFGSQVMCKKNVMHSTTSVIKWLPLSQDLGLKNFKILLKDSFKI